MIIPGLNDTTADAFSTGDLWVLRYHGVEDQHGRQGSSTDDGMAPLLNCMAPLLNREPTEAKISCSGTGSSVPARGVRPG
jgi:hypothetical protein